MADLNYDNYDNTTTADFYCRSWRMGDELRQLRPSPPKGGRRGRCRSSASAWRGRELSGNYDKL